MTSSLFALLFFGVWIAWCVGCAYWNWRTWKRFRREKNAGVFFGRNIQQAEYPVLFNLLSWAQLVCVAGAVFGALAGLFFLSYNL